jgi:enoyl-CoA hydratase
MEKPSKERRDVLKGAAALGALGVFSTLIDSPAEGKQVTSTPAPPVQMIDILYSPDTKVTVERRGAIVLIGINRPYIQNRVDPEARAALAKAYYDYDQDPSLRAAILFGHGDHFSRGIDVDGAKALVKAGKSQFASEGAIDPLMKKGPKLTKPLIAVVHGDTWNMGHELFLVADIRIAAADTNFGQDENTHGRFPGGGSTIRFVREAGWGNAMRYMLTGDHWTAQEAYRMGTVQEIAATKEAGLDRALEIAAKVAACGPLGIQTTLASAHAAIDPSEADAFGKLDGQYSALFSTQDFQEGRDAEAQGRPPVYQGN